MSFESADIFIDAFGNLSVNGQVVKLECLTLHPNPQDPSKLASRLVGRVAIPLSAAVQLHDGLGKMIEQIKKNNSN